MRAFVTRRYHNGERSTTLPANYAYEGAETDEEAFEGVKLACDAGSEDVNATDDYGYTALRGAALRIAGDNQVFGEGAAGLNPKTRDEGWTPLRIYDGVYYTATSKRARETGKTLRQRRRARGVTVPDMDDTVDDRLHQILKH